MGMISNDRLVTLGVVLLPIVYKRVQKWRQAGKTPQVNSLPQGIPLVQANKLDTSAIWIYARYAVLATVLIYSAIQLIYRPVNLFEEFGLPIHAASTILEAKIAEKYGQDHVTANAGLMTALRSVEGRENYMKLGKQELNLCGILCPTRSFYELLLFGIPDRLQEYTWMAIALGLATMDEKRLAWRGWLVGGLAALAVLEATVLMQDWPRETPVSLSSSLGHNFLLRMDCR